METHPYALSWLFFNELLWGREKCKGLICMDEIEERKRNSWSSGGNISVILISCSVFSFFLF
jgi:hypothetical protein